MGLVLGLQGPAKAGKDTVADYLLDLLSTAEKLSFAGNLKKMCKAIFPVSDNDLNTQVGKERPFSPPLVFTQRNLGSVLYWMANTHSGHPPAKGSREKLKSLVGTEITTPRHLLQFVGTDICRMLIPSYHLDIVAKTVKDNPDKDYVVTDVRFPNEGDLILDELEGLVVQVVRSSPTKENIDRSHSSETSMLEWGRFTDVVDNQKNGLPFLFTEVNNLLERQNLCPETTTQSSKSAKVSSFPTVGTDARSGIGTTKPTNSTNGVSE